jgi:DNA-binding transcriptional regulator YiaG
MSTSQAPAAGRVVKLARARRYAATGEGRTIRQRHRLSLPDVAAGAGVSVSTIWRWEWNRTRPQGDAAVRWVELLDALAGISSDEVA